MEYATLYHTLKSLHIIAFVAWMAGMFYLPRLYVYHCDATPDGEAHTMLMTMERKLLRIIMNPAMILTWGLGIWLALLTDAHTQGWFHMKATLVLVMSGVHGMLAMHRTQFMRGTNTKSGRYYRILNEVPTLLLVGIVLLAIFKPL